MTNIIEKMKAAYPVSDESIRLLKEQLTLCHFPKKYRLVEADKYCKAAYFIEKGMTRSFWLVNGEEITTSFSCESALIIYDGTSFVKCRAEALLHRMDWAGELLCPPQN